MKWPNDLVARDAKLAGLLAESRVRAPDLSAPDTSAVVVGLGLNVGWPAADEMPGATSLASCGVTTTVDAVLHALLERIDEHSPTLADDVRAQSATLGRRVRVEQVSRSRDSGPAPVLEGRAVELGDDGRLLVVDDQGRHHWVAVGDVLHLRARDGLDRLE
jgi:BirA family biotin operon repressor/biotin-[acetyl-CoA-carboxylase] ligase